MLTSGFEATPANLLTVPVYVLAGMWTCNVGFLADRYGRRGYFTMSVTEHASTKKSTDFLL